MTGTFRATVRFFPAAEGGRATPAWSGYRALCWFGERGPDGERSFNDCAFHLEGGHGSTVEFPVGRPVEAVVVPARPDMVARRVERGTTFTISEGSKDVGTGTVIEVSETGPGLGSR